MNKEAKNVVVQALDDRIAWAQEQGDTPLWPNGPSALEYVDGLTRPTGSYVEGIETMMDLTALLEECTFEDVTEQVKAGTYGDNAYAEGHLYYKGRMPIRYVGVQAVVVAENLSDKDLEKVRLVRGAHGIELQGDIPQQRTDVIHAIVDIDGLVTWYPGMLTQRTDLNKATIKLMK